MSFSTDTKSTLISQPYKNACCRRAVLNGILFSKGCVTDGKVCVFLENAEVTQYFCLLVKEFFGKEVEILPLTKGGRGKMLRFTSPACEKYIHSLDNPAIANIFGKCQVCESAFFCGVFLSCGRVTNPQKSYRLEFAPSYRKDELLGLLARVSDGFSLAMQKGNAIIYSSNSTVAEDFFASIGMNTTAFAFMNSKIEKELKY